MCTTQNLYVKQVADCVSKAKTFIFFFYLKTL
jgi:hypothetical protein